MSQREDQVRKAKLAQQAEKYDEMVVAMKKVAMDGTELSVEERNLLSVAYENVIGAPLASWRNSGTSEASRVKIEGELKNICNDIIDLLEKYVIPSSLTSVESKVFYFKMKGDYYKYLAEFQGKDDRKQAAENSLQAYDRANTDAKDKLLPTNSIRLGVALNFCVFYYEIRNEPANACQIAKKAFDDALAELDTLSEASFKECTLLMQLLRDKLTLWTARQ